MKYLHDKGPGLNAPSKKSSTHGHLLIFYIDVDIDIDIDGDNIKYQYQYQN